MHRDLDSYPRAPVKSQKTEISCIYVIFAALVSTSVPLQCVICVSGTSKLCVCGQPWNSFHFWLKEILFVLCPPKGEAASRLLWVSYTYIYHLFQMRQLFIVFICERSSGILNNSCCLPEIPSQHEPEPVCDLTWLMTPSIWWPRCGWHRWAAWRSWPGPGWGNTPGSGLGAGHQYCSHNPC